MAGRKNRGRKKGSGGKAQGATDNTSAAEGCYAITAAASPAFWSSVADRECPAEVDHEEGEVPPLAVLLSVDTALLPDLLGWFAAGLEADPAAKLQFSTTLSKAERASVHTLVSEKFGSDLETASEGSGDTRIIAVFKKGKAPKRAFAALSDEQVDLVNRLYKFARDAGNDQLSRDEVSEQVAANALSAELQSLWDSKSKVQDAVQRLISAASSNDVGTIEAISRENPGLVRSNVLDMDSGELPLHVAAKAGHLDALRALVKAGAGIDSKDGRGKTPLQVSRTFEACEAEGVLLQLGAHDPEAERFPLGGALAELGAKRKQQGRAPHTNSAAAASAVVPPSQSKLSYAAPVFQPSFAFHAAPEAPASHACASTPEEDARPCPTTLAAQVAASTLPVDAPEFVPETHAHSSHLAVEAAEFVPTSPPPTVPEPTGPASSSTSHLAQDAPQAQQAPAVNGPAWQPNAVDPPMSYACVVSHEPVEPPGSEAGHRTGSAPTHTGADSQGSRQPNGVTANGPADSAWPALVSDGATAATTAKLEVSEAPASAPAKAASGAAAEPAAAQSENSQSPAASKPAANGHAAPVAGTRAAAAQPNATSEAPAAPSAAGSKANGALTGRSQTLAAEQAAAEQAALERKATADRLAVKKAAAEEAAAGRAAVAAGAKAAATRPAAVEPPGASRLVAAAVAPVEPAAAKKASSEEPSHAGVQQAGGPAVLAKDGARDATVSQVAGVCSDVRVPDSSSYSTTFASVASWALGHQTSLVVVGAVVLAASTAAVLMQRRGAGKSWR